MNSRHLILHPSLGLCPLHFFAKFKNHCPRRRAGVNGIMDVEWGEGWKEREICRMKERHRNRNGGSDTQETSHKQE